MRRAWPFTEVTGTTRAIEFASRPTEVGRIRSSAYASLLSPESRTSRASGRLLTGEPEGISSHPVLTDRGRFALASTATVLPKLGGTTYRSKASNRSSRDPSVHHASRVRASERRASARLRSRCHWTAAGQAHAALARLVLLRLVRRSASSKLAADRHADMTSVPVASTSEVGRPKARLVQTTVTPRSLERCAS